MSRLARLERLERRFGRRCGPLPVGIVVIVAGAGEQPAPATVRELSRTWPPLLLRTWQRLDGEAEADFIGCVQAGAAAGALLVAAP
jgi:hypothetical protein